MRLAVATLTKNTHERVPKKDFSDNDSNGSTAR